MIDHRQLQKAKKRVKAIGEGQTINGAYRLLPNAALRAFRSDLLLIVEALECQPKD